MKAGNEPKTTLNNWLALLPDRVGKVKEFEGQIFLQSPEDQLALLLIESM